MQMFCLKCRTRVEVKDSDLKKEQTPNGRKILRGVCPKCGTKLAKFTK
jgi:hypothetical protein